MLAFQKLVAGDGYEVMLFPLPYLYMSQDEGGDYSHTDTKNIDLIGWGSSGRILKAPIYAPCSCRCVAIWDPNSNNRVFTSLNKVHLADGTLDYCTFSIAHDDSPLWNIGDIIPQGSILGHTGTTGNVTGDHTHFNTAKGEYTGYQAHPQSDGSNTYDLKNSISVWNACYTNDTVIVRGYNHNWHDYTGGIEPTPTGRVKKKYPWVLYAKKLRSKYIS